MWAVSQYLAEISRLQKIIDDLRNPVPTITKTIGTASRNYSTFTSWEADLDNAAIYAAGDTALGEGYADSNFNETVTVNGGGTIGLTDVKMSVASGQRHTGIAGSGLRFVMSSAKRIVMSATNSVNYLCEWIELDHNGFNVSGTANTISTPADATFKNLIVHNDDGSTGSRGLNINLANQSSTGRALRNLVYNIGNSGIFLVATGSTPVFHCLGNTVHDTQSNAGPAEMLYANTSTANASVQNNIITSPKHASAVCYRAAASPAGTRNYNCTSDTTATGANSLISKSAASLFVSTTTGAEDLRLKSGAPAIDEGVDLGTTPAGVNIDINGTDVDATATTWDIGAHEWGDITLAGPLIGGRLTQSALLVGGRLVQ